MLTLSNDPIRCGTELELSHGIAGVIDHLGAADMVTATHPHDYHCTCSDCDCTRAQGWTVQSDCSLPRGGGEFITPILTFGSDNYNRHMFAMGRSMVLGRPVADHHGGNHVHVDQRAMDGAGLHRLYRLFLRYQDHELDILARAGANTVRSYNERNSSGGYYGNRNPVGNFWAPWTDEDDEQSTRYDGLLDHRRCYGSWLRTTGRTVEFRLWNATTSEWRLRLHVGLSVAMVNAARNGEWVEQDDPRPFAEVIEPYADDETLSYMFAEFKFHGFTA